MAVCFLLPGKYVTLNVFREGRGECVITDLEETNEYAHVSKDKVVSQKKKLTIDNAQAKFI